MHSWTDWGNTAWFARLLRSERNSQTAKQYDQQQKDGKVRLALNSAEDVFKLILRSGCWCLRELGLHACRIATAFRALWTWTSYSCIPSGWVLPAYAG